MNESLFCTFRLAGRLYGVSILDTKEVTTETACTPIAHAPKEVVGYVNLRGHIFLALDLGELLGIRRLETRSDRRLVIFKASVGPAFGVLVDEVGDIVAVGSNDIESLAVDDPTQDVFGRAELIANVAKLPNELLIVLNPRRFLPFIERSFAET